ncbi:MAG: MFS transporter [Anaerolineae bacterium]|nr:MFS transporter [Anaerolineae bacterium]
MLRQTKPGRLREFMHGNILVLTITGSLGMFCRSMVFPYASLYILSLGGEPTQIGLINSISPLAGLIMFPLAGYLTDHAGRVKLVTVAGYLSAVLSFAHALAPNWQIIAVARFLQGFMVFQFPPTSAIIADSLSPESRGRGMAAMNTISAAFSIVAPYIAGALLDVQSINAGMRILYGVMGAVNLVSATIHLRYLKETSTQTITRVDLSRLPAILRDTYSNIPATLAQLPGSLKTLTIVIVLGFMSNGVASSFWVVYATEQIGLSSSSWGLILVIETALRSLMYIPAGVIADRYGRTRCVIGALLLSLPAVLMFPMATGFIHVLLLRIIAAIANAFFLTASAALMADMIPRDVRGRVMAAIGRGAVMLAPASGGTGGPGVGFVITFPLMLASLLGGYLYDYDPVLPWIFVSAATMASIILTTLLIRDPQKAEI